MASRGLRSNRRRATPDLIRGHWTFTEGDLDSADVRTLLDLHFQDMRACSPPGGCHVLAFDELRGPAVSFWSLREDGRLLSIGALKELDPRHGEVKSMRAADEARGRGAGRAMLDHILSEARRRGYTRLSLETGSTEPFTAALRLYERNGFTYCGPFGGYEDMPFLRFLTLEL